MKRTTEEMRKVYGQWQESGLSRQAFCKREKIVYATFNYWYKQFTLEQTTGFSEVNLEPVKEVCCELVFPSGVRMIFRSSPPIVWLKELAG